MSAKRPQPVRTGRPRFGESDESQFVSHKIREISGFGRALDSLRNALVSFRYFDPEYGGHVTVVTPRGVVLEQVRGALRACSSALREFSREGFTVDESDPLIAWARIVDADYLTEQAVIDFASSLDWFDGDGQATDPAE